MRLFFALATFAFIITICLYLTREQQRFNHDYTDMKREWYKKIRSK